MLEDSQSRGADMRRRNEMGCLKSE